MNKSNIEIKKVMGHDPMKCDGVLCVVGGGKNWYPGERICTARPYQNFQKKQIEINKLVKKAKFKEINKPLTRVELESKRI